MDKIVHFEIPSKDIGRAKRFYERTFGWELEEWGMGDEKYYGVMMGKLHGGLMEADKTLKTTVVTFGVKSLAEALGKVKKNGGKTVLPTEEYEGYGKMAYVKDTEGNIIGVWEDEK